LLLSLAIRLGFWVWSKQLLPLLFLGFCSVFGGHYLWRQKGVKKLRTLEKESEKKNGALSEVLSPTFEEGGRR